MKVLQSRTTTAGSGGPMACDVSEETYNRFAEVAEKKNVDISSLFDLVMASVPIGVYAHEKVIAQWLDDQI